MFIKQLITFLSIFYTFYVHSQTNTLVIFSDIGLTFSLSVNGEIINTLPQSNVKAFNLGNGWQKVKISTFLKDQEVVLKDSFFINEKYVNKEFTFVLKQNAYDLSFNSIEEPSAPAIPKVPDAPKEIVPLVDNSIYGNLYQAKNDRPIFFENYNKETKKCTVILIDKEIKYALHLLEKYNDDEIKLRYLNTILENNCYSSIQLNQLLTILTLEMDILNSAKKGYSHLTDKQNATILLPALKYQSMQDAFSKFLKDEESISKQTNLNCKVAISESQFNELMSAIKEKKYENEKTIAAKKQLVNKCISTNQALKISELFTHDREKIDVMMSAYNVLTDKENVKYLLNEFQFQETRDEFIKYIDK